MIDAHEIMVNLALNEGLTDRQIAERLGIRKEIVRESLRGVRDRQKMLDETWDAATKPVRSGLQKQAEKMQARMQARSHDKKEGVYYYRASASGGYYRKNNFYGGGK